MAAMSLLLQQVNCLHTMSIRGEVQPPPTWRQQVRLQPAPPWIPRYVDLNGQKRSVNKSIGAMQRKHTRFQS